MSWHDQGIVFAVKNLMPWASSHAYLPTALALCDRIRVFVAFWDEGNVGRLGYIDTDKDDPSIIIDYSKEPLVEDAQTGMFDCDGVSPLSIIEHQKEIRLYYAGWNTNQQKTGPRYSLFIGLLLSRDRGRSFIRHDHNPVIGPRAKDEFIRTGGAVFKTDKQYICLLSAQKGHHSKYGKVLPYYDLERTESTDGITWNRHQTPIFTHKPGVRLGFGRPCIWKNEKGIFEGLFSQRNWNGQYSEILYSCSDDGINWQPLSKTGKAFSQIMTLDQQDEVSFPSIVQLSNKRLAMFYNGNKFGEEGLRLAIWQEE